MSDWTRIEFFVEGTPQPQPKSDPRLAKGGRYLGQMHRDPKGLFAGWSTLVRLAANRAMGGNDILARGVACRVGVEIRVKQAKSNRLPFPAQTPDWSNYRYFVENILRGVVYVDDCQVIGPLPGSKLWATRTRPEGAYVTIEVVDIKELYDELVV